MSDSDRDRKKRKNRETRPAARPARRPVVADRDALGWPRFHDAQVIALRSGDLAAVCVPGRPVDRGMVPSRCKGCGARVWEPLWRVGALFDVASLGACDHDGQAIRISAHACRGGAA